MRITLPDATARWEAAGPNWEELPEYQPPAYVLPPSVLERLIDGWHEVTTTPTRAALGVLGVAGALIGALALRPVTLVSSDAVGPYRARCGLGYYVAGHPSAAIARACHSAYGAHATVFFAGVTVLVVSLGALGALIASARAPSSIFGRAARWVGRQWSSPATAALLMFDVVAGVVALVALRTVSVVTSDARGPLVAHCGISYFVVGSGDPTVQSACRAAYRGHATVFFIAAPLCLLGLAGLRRLSRLGVRSNPPLFRETPSAKPSPAFAHTANGAQGCRP